MILARFTGLELVDKFVEIVATDAAQNFRIAPVDFGSV